MDSGTPARRLFRLLAVQPERDHGVRKLQRGTRVHTTDETQADGMDYDEPQHGPLRAFSPSQFMSEVLPQRCISVVANLRIAMRRSTVPMLIIAHGLLSFSLPPVQGSDLCPAGSYSPVSGMSPWSVRTLPMSAERGRLGNGNRANGVAVSPDGATLFVITEAGCIVATDLMQGGDREVACIDRTQPLDCTQAFKRYQEAQYNDAFFLETTCWMNNGLAITPDGRTALVSDTRYHVIYSVDLVGGKVSVLSGKAPIQPHLPITRCKEQHNFDGEAQIAEFNYPTDIAVSPDGEFALVADYCMQSYKMSHTPPPITIRRVNISTGEVDTFPTFYKHPSSDTGMYGFSNIAISGDGQYALATGGGLKPAIIGVRLTGIRKGEISVIAGTMIFQEDNQYLDGPGTSARFASPSGIAISPDGGSALITDTYNHRIRLLTLMFPAPYYESTERHGEVSTVAGTGDAAPKCYTKGHSPNPAVGWGDEMNIVGGADTGLSAGEYQDGDGRLARFKLPSRIATTPGFSAAFIIEPGSGGVRILAINNTAECRACPAGATSTIDGRQCVVCPSNMTSDGSSQCKCNKGFAKNIKTGNCIACRNGLFKNVVDDGPCQSCSSGTYALETSKTTCYKCEGGKYNPSPGAVGSISCIPCPSNTFSNTNGTSECASCPSGTFSNAGATSCGVGAPSMELIIQLSGIKTYMVRLALGFRMSVENFDKNSFDITRALARAANSRAGDVTVAGEKMTSRAAGLRRSGSLLKVSFKVLATDKEEARTMQGMLTESRINNEMTSSGIPTCVLLQGPTLHSLSQFPFHFVLWPCLIAFLLLMAALIFLHKCGGKKPTSELFPPKLPSREVTGSLSTSSLREISSTVRFADDFSMAEQRTLPNSNLNMLDEGFATPSKVSADVAKSRVNTGFILESETQDSSLCIPCMSKQPELQNNEGQTFLKRQAPISEEETAKVRQELIDRSRAEATDSKSCHSDGEHEVAVATIRHKLITWSQTSEPQAAHEREACAEMEVARRELIARVKNEMLQRQRSEPDLQQNRQLADEDKVAREEVIAIVKAQAAQAVQERRILDVSKDDDVTFQDGHASRVELSTMNAPPLSTDRLDPIEIDDMTAPDIEKICQSLDLNLDQAPADSPVFGEA